MLSPQRFVALDRAQALAAGTSLPESLEGAVLLADLGGFTPLTEAFSAALGPQQGAEAITRLLDQLFDVLINCVYSYGGVVPSFVGDALLGLFPGDDGQRAVACGLAQQAALAALPLLGDVPGTLTLKVGIAAGPLHRLLVGDPAQQQLDILAGGIVTRMAAAEQQAQPGQVILDAATAAALGSRIVGQGTAPGGGRIVRALVAPPPPLPLPTAPPLTWERVRPLIPLPLYPRLQAGQDELLLAEIRPVVALFLRFGGLDYDRDPSAPAQLDCFVRWVQAALAPHQAAILGLTVGDKGSFLHTAFGAPVAHPDDAVRALAVARVLSTPPPGCPAIGPPQIGLTAGRVWAGVYGGAGRATYDVMGPGVNLACRLMERAAPGQVLLTAELAATVGSRYHTQFVSAQQFKGVAAPLPVHALSEAVAAPALALHEPPPRGTLVGRVGELARLEAAATQARQGRGQLIGISGEAGIGKSRLVAEVAGRLLAEGWAGAGGACQVPEMAAAYRVWQPVWRELLGVPATESVNDQITRLRTWLEAVEPTWEARLPLLGPLFGLPIPDSDLTAALAERQRREAREALLVDCLQAVGRQREAPLLLVLEDCHWLDSASHALLEAIGRAIGEEAVLVLLTYRPPDEQHTAALREVHALSHFHELTLTDLSPAGAEALLAAQVAVLQPGTRPLDHAAGAVLAGRAGGNPFYVESLLAYLLAQGVDLHDPVALAQAELPTDLHSLVLGRVDRLGDRQAVDVLRLASVIGRQFRAEWVAGYYAWTGGATDLAAPLAALMAAGLVAADGEDGDNYLFKHSLIQEVIYNSLAYATRRQLHQELAAWLERTVKGAPDLDLLAYHYGQSANGGKQREYYRKAGDAAMATYLPGAAAPHYTKLLPLIAPSEQVLVLLVLGDALEQTGDWEVAEQHYTAAYEQAQAAGDTRQMAWAQRGLGQVACNRGDLPAAQAYGEQSRARFVAQGEPAGLAAASTLLGRVAARQGDYILARTQYEESLALWQKLGNRREMALALRSLALAVLNLLDYAAHRRYLTEALALQQELGDLIGMAYTIHNLGFAAHMTADYEEAGRLYGESLQLSRQTGDRLSEYWNLNQLGNLRQVQGQMEQAREFMEASLAVATSLMFQHGVITSLSCLGEVELTCGNYAAARAWVTQSLRLAQEGAYTLEIVPLRVLLGHISLRQEDRAGARQLFREGLITTVEHDVNWVVAKSLLGLTQIWLVRDDAPALVGGAQLHAAILAHIAGRNVAAWFHSAAVEVGQLLATRLDPACRQAATVAGQVMSLDEAVAWALVEDQRLDPS